MGALRIVVIVLVASAISAGVTGWILNMRQDSARLENAYYPTPPAPITPLGDPAAAAKPAATTFAANPLANDPASIAEGHKLFMAMNCASCHGYDAKGGMGPNLTDTYWRYGGKPELIYESILDGRPQGMPEWGVVLPRRSIWQLVSYIQSLGGTVPPGQTQVAGSVTDRGQNKGASDQQ